ncbi:hypothetical protein HUM50_001550 [Campylobacter coli]|nr:hypothetical protein [Campylobacter coli]
MSNAPVIINNVEVNLNIKENKVFINSLDLAKVFNKNHKAVLNKLEKELKYWQNYDEYEEKWKKILRR